MIDTYLYVAASALASNTVIRSSFGAAFPVGVTFSTTVDQCTHPSPAICITDVHISQPTLGIDIAGLYCGINVANPICFNQVSPHHYEMKACKGV